MQALDIKPLITAKEARKILGSAAENLTNEELEALVSNLEQIARTSVRDYLVRKNDTIKEA